MSPELPKKDSCCEELWYFLGEGKLPLQYSPRLHKIEIQSKANEWVQELNYCPFCGSDWRNNLEGRWFEEVARLGINGDYLEILKKAPERLRSSEWWKAQGGGK